MYPTAAATPTQGQKDVKHLQGFPKDLGNDGNNEPEQQNRYRQEHENADEPGGKTYRQPGQVVPGQAVHPAVVEGAAGQK